MLARLAAALVPAALPVLPLLPAQQQPPADTDLQIRRIVLYKHGVGYFERGGTVEGRAELELAFKAEQMKDVLKSLFAVDLDGGRIGSVLYDSKDPIEKQLEEVLFQVPEGNALTQLLMQLQGARVQVTIGARALTGRIVGIEPVQRQTPEGTVVTHRLVLLADEGALTSFELLDASEITMLDENVRRDLARVMDVYAKARHADRKTVHLRAEGEGQRRLRVGYIIETPIWKTSYRLLLEEGGPPRLQGWAIVENRTDEDWNDVALSFVAGSPLSFVLDLYTSYYPQRPVLDMGVVAAGRDKAEGRVVTGSGELFMGASRGFAPEQSEKKDRADDAAPAPTLGALLETTMAPAAQGAAVGELFAYEAKGPVTIRRGQAALVPILFEKLPSSERVLYYRADFSPHPAHAVRLENTTGLTLERGPVTVFEGATCLGEGMLTRTLGPGMHEILPYALETGVEVEPRTTAEARPVSRGILVNGVLTLVHTETRQVRYAVRNKTGKPFRLVVDHPKAGGDYALTRPAEAAEELPGHLRFALEVPAGDGEDLLVQETRPVRTHVAIASQSTDEIRAYASQPWLSDAARELLERVAAQMAERAEADRRIAALNDERARLVRDQDTLRKNMQVLRDSPQERKLRDEYVERLTAAMRRIDEIDASLAELGQLREGIDQRIARELAAHRDPQ